MEIRGPYYRAILYELPIPKRAFRKKEFSQDVIVEKVVQ